MDLFTALNNTLKYPPSLLLFLLLVKSLVAILSLSFLVGDLFHGKNTSIDTAKETIVGNIFFSEMFYLKIIKKK